MSRHIELLLSRRETFPINLCSGGCINSKKAIGERLYGFFFFFLHRWGGVGRLEEGTGRGRRGGTPVGVYSCWSVLIKMPGPHRGTGVSAPLHLWVTTIGPCSAILWFREGREGVTHSGRSGWG